MPQFDKITFFNQLFWLLFFFSGFYLLLLHYFLPKLSAVIKARQKMLNFFFKGVSVMFDERNEVKMSVQNDCSTLLAHKNLNRFLSTSMEFMRWLKLNLFLTFNGTFKKSLGKTENRLYHQTSLYYFSSKLINFSSFISE